MISQTILINTQIRSSDSAPLSKLVNPNSRLQRQQNAITLENYVIAGRFNEVI